jgi:hypothetical protein
VKTFKVAQVAFFYFPNALLEITDKGSWGDIAGNAGNRVEALIYEFWMNFAAAFYFTAKFFSVL